MYYAIYRHSVKNQWKLDHCTREPFAALALIAHTIGTTDSRKQGDYIMLTYFRKPPDKILLGGLVTS